jgi:DNA polymerase-3 subunit alpha
MGKKLIEKLNHLYPKFIAGGKANGHDPQVLEKIWDDWRKFASYAFNKSHATCYSWVAYQTAYLKANYPAQFMAADMTRNLSNITTITKDMDECKAMGIQTLGPDVNESVISFGVNSQGDIRFGLGAIKGVGSAAAEAVIAERNANGPYKSIFDFVQRVNLNACNKRCIESLALSGGFDCFPEVTREQYFAEALTNSTYVEELVRYGQRYQSDRRESQNSLFGDMGTVDTAYPHPPEAEPWTALDRLNKERDLVGIYLSAHPLDEYAVILNNVCNTHMVDLANKADLAGHDLTFGGIVTGVRRAMTRNNKPCGFVKMEDYSGTFELALFGQDWAHYANYMEEGNTLFISARYQPRRFNPEIFDLSIGNIEFMADIKDTKIESITIVAQLDHLTDMVVSELATLVNSSPGKAQLYFQILDSVDHCHVAMRSRDKQLNVDRKLLQFIDSQPGLSYRIN